MKKKKGCKLLVAIAFVAALCGAAFADWIEPYDSNTRNDLYMEDATIHGNITLYGTMSTSSGIVNSMISWSDLPAADTETVVHTVALTTAAVAISTTITAITQPSRPRNLALSFDSITGSSTLVGSALITGVNSNGTSVTETVTISDAKVHTSSYAYISITSIKYTLTSNGDTAGCYLIYCNAGPSTRLGLCGDIAKTSDVLFVDEAGTATTTYTANATYDTIDFVTDPNATNDYFVVFNQKAVTK